RPNAARYERFRSDVGATPASPERYLATATMLATQNLSFSHGTIQTLRDVTMEMAGGRVTCVMGRSGVGKTTLMKCLMGLLKPAGGFVWLDGREVAGLPANRRARAGVALVP